jgi:hypothetical protein
MRSEERVLFEAKASVFLASLELKYGLLLFISDSKIGIL